MSDLLDKDTVAFEAEGRLLQELGLRLVASPQVALVELIKNAYDADSPTCTVTLGNKGASLKIVDEGSGMTVEDFKQKWMRIATSSKTKQERSSEYGRKLTGAKGIGRFAVRYLGDQLELQSVAEDPKYKCRTILIATFEWNKLDLQSDLSKTGVEYILKRAPDDTPVGTTLTIRKLRTSARFAKDKKLRTEVLRIVSPLRGLDAGRFERGDKEGKGDPGFSVSLPGDEGGGIDLAQQVLANYWARLTVDLNHKGLTFNVTLAGGEKPPPLHVKVPKNFISNGLRADVRFFPRRKGVFQRKEFTGQDAWSWVWANSGVKVVDHGFHIHPYGFEKDDWLFLDRDKSHNEREWQTAIAKKHFPLSAAERRSPAANPMLNLPSNLQLVGAVFVETRRNFSSEDEVDLLPTMDREGLVANEAFYQLREYVRAGIEFLAKVDKQELTRRQDEAAKAATEEAEAGIKAAIEHIKKSSTLTKEDKNRIVFQYQELAAKVAEAKEYTAQARKNLLAMSLLGVVAGFMTHESKAVIHNLDIAAGQLLKLAKNHPELQDIASQLTDSVGRFQEYLDYSQLFVRDVRRMKQASFPSSPQVRHIVKQFGSFASDRGIEVLNEVDSKVVVPPMPVSVYSGVLLNLFTNALKAVIAAGGAVDTPRVAFRGWNEGTSHTIEVLDNGLGIPDEVRERIWDPLFTTTSDIENPLGSGMGLGLTLVKEVVREFDGTVQLLRKAPAGFTTCFRVTFKQTKKG